MRLGKSPKMENIRQDQIEITELKTTITELKNTLEGFNNRLDETEEKIGQLKGKAVELTQLQQQKKRNKKE